MTERERYILYGAATLAGCGWLLAFLASRYAADIHQQLAVLAEEVQAVSVSYSRHLSNGGHVHEGASVGRE